MKLKKLLSEANKLYNPLSDENKSYLLKHISDYHSKPSHGSYFSKSPKEIISIIEKEMKKAGPEKLKRIAEGDGEFRIKVGNIGYNLVISKIEAERLADAKVSSVKKIEGGGSVEVPSVTTSLSKGNFATNEFVVIVRKNQNKPDEFFVPTTFPIGGKYKSTTLPASKWGGDFAVIIPNK